MCGLAGSPAWSTTGMVRGCQCASLLDKASASHGSLTQPLPTHQHVQELRPGCPALRRGQHRSSLRRVHQFGQGWKIHLQGWLKVSPPPLVPPTNSTRFTPSQASSQSCELCDTKNQQINNLMLGSIAAVFVLGVIGILRSLGFLHIPQSWIDCFELLVASIDWGKMRVCWASMQVCFCGRTGFQPEANLPSCTYL